MLVCCVPVVAFEETLQLGHSKFGGRLIYMPPPRPPLTVSSSECVADTKLCSLNSEK